MLSNILLWLAKKLYPNGRAFRMPEPASQNSGYISEDGANRYVSEDGLRRYVTESSGTNTIGGIIFRLHRAINITFAQVWADTVGIFDHIFPDNPNFTIEDARDWYRRFGIYDSGNVSLSDMKLAIAQKQSFPIVPLNKQNYLFIQQQLQAAGFNVFVYENRFDNGSGGWMTKTPEQILGITMGASFHSTSIFHGVNQRHGAQFSKKIANYLEPEKDASFVIGANYRSTFYVSSGVIGTFATMPVARQQEFRQLLLKLKRAETVGFLFINFV